MAKIAVTGGAGYIGSITAYHLRKRGHQIVVIDNLSRGHRKNVPPEELRVVDIRDRKTLSRLLEEERCEAIVHFAALIAVGESVQIPEVYFSVNVGGSASLLEAAIGAGIRNFVFSSSAAVYGTPREIPIKEDHVVAPVSPYGESKAMVERMLDWLDQCERLRYVSLRYFNACGADPEAGLGEEHEPETHLIPRIFQAIKTGQPLTVFGNDYETADGTCIRDYIHVSDLALAHVQAIEYLLAGGSSAVLNAGTGHGYSVLEVIRAVEEVTGKKVPYVIGPRRAGDAPVLVADPTRIQQLLGWRPLYTSLRQMVASAWEFESQRSGIKL